MNNKNKDLNLIYAICLVDLLAIGITFPLFSNYLRDLGASHLTVGLISSLYSGLQVLSGPIIGSWSDIRDRKSVLLITLAICSLSYALLGLTTSMVLIVISRIILGVTKHTQTICKAIITDILPGEERAGAFGRAAAFGSIGFIAGPVIGGHVSELSNGFSLVCSITSALFIINIVLMSQLSDDYGNGGTTRKKATQLSLGGRIKAEFSNSISDFTDINWGALWECFLVRFLFGFSVTMYFSQQSMYLKEQFDLSQRHIGYTISYFSFVGTFSGFFVCSITDLFYKNGTTCSKRLVHCFMLMTISFICLYLAPNIQMFLLFLTPFSVSCTLLRIVSMEMMLRKSEIRHRGSLSGTSNSIMSIARFLTPVTSGVISDILGTGSTLLFAAVPAVIGTVLCARIRRRENLLTKNM